MPEIAAPGGAKCLPGGGYFGTQQPATPNPLIQPGNRLQLAVAFCANELLRRRGRNRPGCNSMQPLGA